MNDPVFFLWQPFHSLSPFCSEWHHSLLLSWAVQLGDRDWEIQLCIIDWMMVYLDWHHSKIIIPDKS